MRDYGDKKASNDTKKHKKARVIKSVPKSGSEFCIAKLNYDRLRRVMSYDTLRVVMMCLRHSLKLQGNHIITLGNAKLITFGEAKFITKQ